MKAPLRIGLVTPAWPGSNTANGIATAVAHLATGLQGCGHEVTIIPFAVDAPDDFPRVVVLPEQRWSPLERLRIRLGYDRDGIVHRNVGRRIATAAQEAVVRYGIEVLVMEETQGWADAVSRHVSIPVVVTLHGPWCLHKEIQGNGDTKADAQREARELEGLRGAGGITAPSRDTLERTAALWTLPECPVAVIHNPMPVSSVAAARDTHHLLFVGRFDFHKGGDLMIQAFERLSRMHPSCRLTFAGPDVGFHDAQGHHVTLATTLSALPAEVRARIDALGPQSREQIAQLRTTHGIAVVASRYENFGGTMLEAMAAETALVCTRVGGGAEILSDGVTALLVPPEDPQAIAEACLKLLHSPALAQSLGVSARAFVESHLSPEEIGRQMADFLTPLCRNE